MGKKMYDLGVVIPPRKKRSYQISQALSTFHHVMGKLAEPLKHSWMKGMRADEILVLEEKAR